MAIDLEIIEGPDEEPVTLAQAKLFCKVDADLVEDDEYLTALITATREFIEKRTGRAFGLQTIREWRTVPRSGVIRLCRAPVVEVLSVEVDDQPQTSLLLPGNRLSISEELAGKSVVVSYTAGWSTPPKLALQALQILISHWYGQREPIITGTIVAEVPNHFNAIETLLSWGSEMPAR